MKTVSNVLFLVLSFFMSAFTFGPLAEYCAPAPPEIPVAADTLTQEITVMSFNVYYQKTGEHGLPNRLNGVVQTIRKEMPDSFGLQEAHADWRDALLRELGGQYAIACERGRAFEDDEGAPIFYRKDRYELVSEEQFWLSLWPGRPSYSWGTSFPRIAGYAVLRDKTTGFTYAHFNAHFDNFSGTARVNSARMIADRVNAMGLPAVFTADANAAPGSKPMEYLEAGGLTDMRKAAAVTDEGITYNDFRDDGPLLGCLLNNTVLDYIYANHYLREAAEFKVIRDKYDGTYPSDHFATAARLTLAN